MQLTRWGMTLKDNVGVSGQKQPSRFLPFLHTAAMQLDAFEMIPVKPMIGL